MATPVQEPRFGFAINSRPGPVGDCYLEEGEGGGEWRGEGGGG